MTKTFEQLIINIIDEEGNIRATDVLALLKQVREATIKECEEIATKNGSYSTAHNIMNLPTDKIRIDENTPI